MKNTKDAKDIKLGCSNHELFVIGLLYSVIICSIWVSVIFTDIKRYISTLETDLYVAKVLVVNLSKENDNLYEMVQSLNDALDEVEGENHQLKSSDKMIKDLR